MPESLFDDFCRNDGRPALFDEPTFGFLNRRAGARWQRVRDLLDEWFGRVPDEEARADLRGRLRSGAEVDFRSAFFELYCHEALRRAGWGLVRVSEPQLGRPCQLSGSAAVRRGSLSYGARSGHGWRAASRARTPAWLTTKRSQTLVSGLCWSSSTLHHDAWKCSSVASRC